MKICLLALGLSALVFAGCDKDDDDDNNDQGVNSTDIEFAMRASMANYAEIGAGQLASTKALAPGVMDYGEMMVTDHTDALADLRDITDDLNLYAPDSLDAAHVTLMAELDGFSGREFDSAYIHSQVMDHQNAIQLFQNLVNNGNNSRLRNYASSMLPHLNLHFQKADSIANEY
jgi:putative membrane protein